MNLHPKTIRRVSLLLIGFVLIAGLLVGAWAWRQKQKTAELLARRDAGMTAFANGDYPAALNALAGYVNKRDEDFEALLTCAKARVRVEEIDDSHIAEGIRLFRILQQMRPDHLEVRHDLLDLYIQAGYATEAIEVADVILEHNPDDLPALKAKADALQFTNEYDKAVALYERINKLDPTDLPAQFMTLDLYRRLQRPPADAMNRAQAFADAHPEDPRFVLLLAAAHEYAGQLAKTQDLLRQAAQGPVDDAEFVRLVMTLLDAGGMYPEAQQFLERAVAETQAPQVVLMYVQRLWQNNRDAAVIERLKDLDLQHAEADLLAYRAMAHHALGQTADRDAVLAALDQRSGADAAAWTSALKAEYADPAPAPKELIETLRAALRKSPDNAVIRFRLGDAYERMHEREPAMEAWAQSAQLTPSWYLPHLKLARAQAQSGRLDTALDAATRACHAAPTKLQPLIGWAVVQWMRITQQPDPATESTLLQSVVAIQQQVPNEPETLPIYVGLLARAGESDQAADRIRTALADPKLDPAVLPVLSNVSRSYNLGMEPVILEALEAHSRTSPRLALAHAAELAADGRSVDGLALMKSASEAAPTDATQWTLALAQYLELIRDPAAAATWIALGDAHPQDLDVQVRILTLAHSARGDRDFWSRTVDRVEALSTEDALLWQIEEASWLIGSKEEKDHSAAVGMLTDIVRSAPSLVDPHVLLATALEQVGNIGGASREMQAAADLRPKDETILLRLARLLQQEGRFSDARGALNRLMQLDTLSAGGRQQVTILLAQQGDRDVAIRFLESVDRTGTLDDAGALLLAEMLNRQGRYDEAQAVYERLLSGAAVEPETLLSAATFHASRGSMDLANQIMGRLDSNPARPGMSEVVRARFAEQFGSPADAEALFVAATTAAPTDPNTWRNLAEFQVRAGRSQDALATLDAGLKANPSQRQLMDLKALIETAGRGGDALAVNDLLASGGNTAEATALMQVLEQSASLPPKDVAEALKPLADRYPRFKPVHMELIRRLLAAGQVKQAGDAAARAMTAFPSDPGVAALVTDITRLSGDWKQVEVVARQWRDRSLNDPMKPEFAIAEARLRQRDPAGAMRLINRYLPRVTASPQTDPTLTAVSARVLAANGQVTAARQLLEPLLDEQPLWRRIWMAVASEDLPSSADALVWLERVRQAIPAEQAGERLDLAIQYRNVAARRGVGDALIEARSLLEDLTADPRHGHPASLLLAEVATSQGDIQAAIECYRRVLLTTPDQPDALNNLAYLIMIEGGDLAEAEQSARRAVELSPRASAFHDTLGRILLRQGQADAALTSFHTALDLNATNLEALVGQGLALAALERDADVAAVIRQIDALLNQGARPSPQIQDEIATLRQRRTAAADTR